MDCHHRLQGWTVTIDSFFCGALGLKESPRWLYRRGRKDEALAILAHINGEAEGKAVLDELIVADRVEAEKKAALAASARGETLLQRKYVLPFLISMAVLICNQAIGFNAIQYFSITMFKSAGLTHGAASVANVVVWLVPRDGARVLVGGPGGAQDPP